MSDQLFLPIIDTQTDSRELNKVNENKVGFTRGDVNRAGEIFRKADTLTPENLGWAADILGKWRARHNYPINTFQATLRHKLKRIDKEALVAQRLKRIPSIVEKLRRFPDMQLVRMQDIGGLRAVVG